MIQTNRTGHVTRWRGSVLLLLVLLLAIAASACGNNGNSANNTEASPGASANSQASPEEKQTQVIKHGYGETEIPLHPKRIAVIGLEDVMLSLGAPLVYAYGFDGYYLYDQLKEQNIQLSNSSDLTPNLEAILETQPDLIVLQQYFTDEKGYQELSKIAPTIAFKPDDWKTSITEIGKALGLEDKAQEVIKASEDKIASAKGEIVSAVGEDKSVLYIRPSDKDLQVFFPSFMPLLYEKLGLKPDVSVADFQKEAEDDWGVNTSLEKLPSIKADYVFAIYGGSISSQEDYEKEVAAQSEVEKLQVWKAMPAVQQNHVFKVSARTWMSSGPIAEGHIIDDTVAAVTGKK
ncbi:ABC transporter substrate-binding protein [Paenibacillus sp. JDR-2]|uniref:ABC transporter substrate-binding protein n=1 Tax=Paenibacillus sp. (strain JDR-2) TaxID=324057 RepID=UPI0001664A19|nr:ABC transporter substrate-binding protein [Paenibacillus sp. JDR-2]ACT03743.1 periplasmic binding protein [Paenibacillus sp. JDR-2]